jgi:hypothetical membrane protein
MVELLLYVVLDAVAQSLPPHYSPIRDAESDLAVGPYGYIMTVNFLNRGILSFIFLYALIATMRSTGALDPGKRPRGALVFSAWAFGSFVLAIFPTDVPATPVSAHGAVHLIVALVAFIGGAFGALLLSLEFKRFGSFKFTASVGVGLGALSVFLLFLELGLPFVAPHLAARVGGLTERLFLGSVLMWIGIVSLLVYRQGTSRPPSFSY